MKCSTCVVGGGEKGARVVRRGLRKGSLKLEGLPSEPAFTPSNHVNFTWKRLRLLELLTQIIIGGNLRCKHIQNGPVFADPALLTFINGNSGGFP